MQTLLFKHEGASAKLSFWATGEPWVLKDLWSDTPGEGHAKAVMEQIIEYADKENIAIQLIAQQYGPIRHGMDTKDLVIFYQKFGFEFATSDKRSGRMVRKESREKHTL